MPTGGFVMQILSVNASWPQPQTLKGLVVEPTEMEQD